MTPSTSPSIDLFPSHKPVSFRARMHEDYLDSRSFRLCPWRRFNGDWHRWERPLYISGKPHTAALIWMNGNGRDGEVRWRVYDHMTMSQPRYDSTSSVTIPDSLRDDPQIVNGLGTRSRYYPGRGIQDATSEDVIWLARWCDERLNEIYRQYLPGVW